MLKHNKMRKVCAHSTQHTAHSTQHTAHSTLFATTNFYFLSKDRLTHY